jgi:hypothetical protein
MTATPTTAEERGLTLLLEARFAWEELAAEVGRHLAPAPPPDTYLCLACAREAKAFVDAVAALADEAKAAAG